MQTSESSEKRRILLLIFSIILTIAIVSSGIIYFIYSRNKIINIEYSTLESIGRWKLQQIIDWRQERKTSLDMLISDNLLIQADNYINNQSKTSQEYIMNRFEDIQGGEKVHFCSLLDENFKAVLATYDLSEPLSQATKNALLKSQNSDTPIISDFFICSNHDVHIDIVSPLRNSQQNIIAYLILRVNAEDYLFPLVQTWPLKSETSESLLFKVDENDILFLNKLRHTPNTALEYRIPLTNTALPAVQVAEGKKGIIVGNDYRNVKTIAYGSAIPETDWYLLAKIDYSEAFRSLNLQLLYIGLIIVLLTIISPIIIMFIIKTHDFNISHRLYQVEKEKNATNSFFRFVINNIPQRIFWKDTDSKYLGGNIQFAKDMGYEKEEDIVGLSDYDFFEKSVADDFKKVDAEVMTSLQPKVGYENEDVHFGKKVWMRKSKAPIIDESQNVLGVLCTYENIEEEKKNRDELKKHSSFLQTVYENINAILFSIDSDGIITFMEGKILKELNITSEVWIGRPFSEIFKGKEIELACRKSLSGEPSTVDEAAFGNTVLNFFFQPAFESEKGVSAVYGVAVDITDLHKAIKNLQRSNQELEQFAYVASHDLQEPLRLISNFTQLLEKKYAEKLDERAKKYIFYAVDGAKRMQILINDLLNYSRINTSEKIHEKVDMNKIVEQVKQNMSTTINENNAKIEYADLPLINAEPTQMYQIMQNLLSNALKFRGKDSPVIRISCEILTTYWQFKVQDNGIGIEEKYKDKIFEIFQRLHSRSEYEGTGIGLALCKRIAIKHGGDIWFESTPGEGTSFYFTVKKEKGDNNDATD